MNLQSYIISLVLLILCLSPDVIGTIQKPTDRKCLATCMDYCTNDSESGIPMDLCNNACMTMCYSARKNLGSDDLSWESDK
ncbi:hypothetical protein I4U23_028808 [Adineta vaga]|nr:hypothetical protein I4U23_028808 [Adineta vaga]